MHINEIIIGNFRSIHNQRIRLKDMCVLVGENNSGKTNIIKALELFFCPFKKSTSEDKNKKRSDIIKISIKATIPLPQERKKLEEKLFRKVKSKNVIIERKHRYYERPRYYINQHLVGDPRNLLIYFRNKFLLINPLRDIELEDIEKEFEKKFAGKLSPYMREEVIAESQKAVKRLNKHLSPHLSGIVESFKQALELRQGAISFTFAPDVEEIINNVKFNLDLNDKSLDLRTKGQGIRSIASMIFLGILSKDIRVTLVAVEEPELHLHPPLIRLLMRRLIEMSRTRQIIMTTHNQNIIDSVDPEKIVRVEMQDSETKVISPRLSDESISNFYKYVLDRHAEVFYSKRCIIVEGASDANFLRLISEKILLKKGRKSIRGSLDEHGIHFLYVKGEFFDKPTPFLDAFQIEWIAIVDADKWRNGQILVRLRALQFDRKYPKIFNELSNIDRNLPLTRDIKEKLYKYFNVIVLPGRIEDIIITPTNGRNIMRIFKKYLLDRYSGVVIRRQRNPDIMGICKRLLGGNKIEWSISLGKYLKEEDISPSIKNLIKLLVLHPKIGAL